MERSLQHLGEAGKHVSPAMRARHPEINWTGIIGLRNVLAHEYGDIVHKHEYGDIVHKHEYGDIVHEKVWHVASREIPGVIAAPEAIVAALPPPETRETKE